MEKVYVHGVVWPTLGSRTAKEQQSVESGTRDVTCVSGRASSSVMSSRASVNI